MTENRFKNVGKDILQYGEWWCSANGEHCADVIATAMNELVKKNVQLKSNIQDMQTGTYINAKNIIRELKEENEQLKKILGISENDNVNDIVEVLNLQQTEIWELQRVNEQLKEEIKDLNDVLARYEEKELKK